MQHSITLAGKKGSYTFIPAEKSSVLRANGKFSVIYKGQSATDGRTVVIKMLHPRWNNSPYERKRFVAEYLKAVPDPIFPAMIDICENGTNLYMVREFIEGKDLSSFQQDKLIASVVKKEGRAQVALKILDAFIKLHSYQIIHGDIKPSNIMLVPEKESVKVKIIDMGLSLPFDHSVKRSSENPLPFSLIYASPELMLNYPDLMRPASDIYSLALTIYEFLCGEKPFDLSHPALMMSIQLNEPMAPHKKVNSATLDVLNTAAFKFRFPKPIQHYSTDQVRKSLRSAMICRYQSMSDFKVALEVSFFKKDNLFKKLFR